MMAFSKGEINVRGSRVESSLRYSFALPPYFVALPVKNKLGGAPTKSAKSLAGTGRKGKLKFSPPDTNSLVWYISSRHQLAIQS